MYAACSESDRVESIQDCPTGKGPDVSQRLTSWEDTPAAAMVASTRLTSTFAAAGRVIAPIRQRSHVCKCLGTTNIKLCRGKRPTLDQTLKIDLFKSQQVQPRQAALQQAENRSRPAARPPNKDVLSKRQQDPVAAVIRDSSLMTAYSKHRHPSADRKLLHLHIMCHG